MPINLDVIQSELQAIERELPDWNDRFTTLVDNAKRFKLPSKDVQELEELRLLVQQCLDEESTIIVTLAYLHALLAAVENLERLVNEGFSDNNRAVQHAVGELAAPLYELRNRMHRLRKLREQVVQRGKGFGR